MVIETLGTWMFASGALYLALYKEPNDKKKIAHTFKNINFGFGDKLPILQNDHKSDTHTTYSYSVPYGLLDTPKLEYILERTLNKPVRVSMNNLLHVKVYHEKLKERYDYMYKKAEKWNTPIGKDMDGLIYHDFDKIPMMTVAGMTRQGKTVLLKLIMAHLIKQHPEDVEIHIIDLKGGLEFHKYRNLKQVKSFATNVNEAHDCLKEILFEMQQEMAYFTGKGYNNIVDTPIRKRRFIIIDEGAELAPRASNDKKKNRKYNDCQDATAEIARIGGGIGFRQIFCTQYPVATTLPREVKQNSDAKIAFRLPTEVASRVAIDEEGANELTCPGRAIYRTHEKKVVQVPLITDKQVWEMVGEYNVTKPEVGAEAGKNPYEIG